MIRMLRGSGQRKTQVASRAIPAWTDFIGRAARIGLRRLCQTRTARRAAFGETPEIFKNLDERRASYSKI
jgi:hypothetical protein